MTSQSRRKNPAKAEAITAQNELREAMTAYVQWCRHRSLSPETVAGRRKRLRLFSQFCSQRGVHRLGELDTALLQGYEELLRSRKSQRTGQPLLPSTRRLYLSTVRGFVCWLYQRGLLLFDLGAKMNLPRSTRGLPQLLRPKQVELLLSQPNIEDLYGLRDRAILELLYSSGLRRGELVGLDIGDLDLDAGVVRVRHGKGGHERLVPVGARAVRWLRRYSTLVRPVLCLLTDESAIFVGRSGRISAQSVTDLVKKYLRAAGLGHTGSCHLLRHSMATAMLEGGADLRSVQLILGHADLSSTELYTQVSIKRLEEVYAATHPWERGSGSPKPPNPPPSYQK